MSNNLPLPPTKLPIGSHVKTMLPAVLITLLTLSATLVAGYITQKAVNAKLSNFFAIQSDQIANAYYERLYTHVTILEGIRGFWNATGHFTQANFTTYFQSLDLNAIDKTGVSSYFYIPVVKEGEVAKFTDAIRNEPNTPALYQKFTLHPPVTTTLHYPVTYFTPFTGLEKTLGFDFAGFAERLDAINYARDQNALATTKIMTLVSGKPGFFFLLPLYHTPQKISTPRERQASFAGIIGAVFSSDSSFQQIFGGTDPYPYLDFQIYQGAASTPDRLLYDHDKAFASTTSRYETTRIITLQNQTWTIKIQNKPSFSLSNPEERLPLIVFITGIIGTLAIAIFSSFKLAKLLRVAPNTTSIR